MDIRKMQSWIAGLLAVVASAAAGCGAPKPEQQAPEVSIDDDGVLFRYVSIEDGPGDLAAVIEGGVVVGLLEGNIETAPDGAYFWAPGTADWYVAIVSAYGPVELQILPGGAGSETAEDGASFEPQGTFWKCGSSCYTNYEGGCAGQGECRVFMKY